MRKEKGRLTNRHISRHISIDGKKYTVSSAKISRAHPDDLTVRTHVFGQFGEIGFEKEHMLQIDGRCYKVKLISAGKNTRIDSLRFKILGMTFDREFGSDVFLRFNSQEERRQYGGSCFLEMQICYQPKGTTINQIVAVRDFWHLDSLYVDGNVPYYNTFYSTYVSIFGPCIRSNLSEGPFDTWCVNYFPPDRINGIRERAMTARPEGYEVLMEWLEEAEKHNGFYILGL